MFKRAGLMLFVGIVGLSAIQSCSKDKTSSSTVITCDSTKTYTYTVDVKPIFDANCASFACHSSIVAANGVNLEDYAGAKLATESGKVLCAIKHECSPSMPQSAPKLADSLIQKVQCWANGGYQN